MSRLLWTVLEVVVDKMPAQQLVDRIPFRANIVSQVFVLACGRGVPAMIFKPAG